MGSVESWMSSKGYSLHLNRLSKDTVRGSLDINLNTRCITLPFKGLTNSESNSTLEFVFFIDWNYYVVCESCYTCFLARKNISQEVEYLNLSWLMIYKNSGFKTRNISIKGNNFLIDILGKTNSLKFPKESNQVPYPFPIDIVESKVDWENEKSNN